MVLAVKNLSFAYPNGITALKDISFRLEKGQKLGIIGGNGAGKSTLLFALANLFSKEKIKGEIIKDKGKMGLVFQNPDDQIIGSTVEDDIAFSLFKKGMDKKIIKENIKGALGQVHLSGFEKRSPFELSFGEKKRLAAAAILIGEPDIILLDEPSLGLDLRERQKIIDIFKKIRNTLIIASHDLDLVRTLTEKVLILNKGEALILGDTAEVLENIDLLKDCGMAL